MYRIKQFNKFLLLTVLGDFSDLNFHFNMFKGNSAMHIDQFDM